MTKDIRFEGSLDISHCDNYYGDYSTVISIEKDCVSVYKDVEIDGINVLKVIQELQDKIAALEEEVKKLKDK